MIWFLILFYKLFHCKFEKPLFWFFLQVFIYITNIFCRKVKFKKKWDTVFKFDLCFFKRKWTQLHIISTFPELGQQNKATSLKKSSETIVFKDFLKQLNIMTSLKFPIKKSFQLHSGIPAEFRSTIGINQKFYRSKRNSRNSGGVPPEFWRKKIQTKLQRNSGGKFSLRILKHVF